MAQKNFRAMAQTLIFGGFEPWLKPTFDMQILTSFFYAMTHFTDKQCYFLIISSLQQIAMFDILFDNKSTFYLQ